MQAFNFQEALVRHSFAAVRERLGVGTSRNALGQLRWAIRLDEHQCRTKTRFMTRPYRVALPAAVSGLLVCAGCATNPSQSASQSESEVPPVRTITLALRPMPSMKMVTPGPAAGGIMTGLIGFAITESVMTKEGNAIVRMYHVDDPAVSIGNSLRDEIAANGQMVVKDAAGVQITSYEFREMAKAYPGSSEILDVRTTEWAFMYLPFDLNHYGVQYGVEATLIDARKHKLLASAKCSHDPKRSAGAPTHVELLENDAARLKILSAKAAERCMAEILPRLLVTAK